MLKRSCIEQDLLIRRSQYGKKKSRKEDKFHNTFFIQKFIYSDVWNLSINIRVSLVARCIRIATKLSSRNRNWSYFRWSHRILLVFCWFQQRNAKRILDCFWTYCNTINVYILLLDIQYLPNLVNHKNVASLQIW